MGVRWRRDVDRTEGGRDIESDALLNWGATGMGQGVGGGGYGVTVWRKVAESGVTSG